jgi:hypothetical protein
LKKREKKVKSCQEMAEFEKIKNYKLQITKNLVRCAHNWNDGMVEYWKVEFFKTVLIIPHKRDKISLYRFSIPVFYHSIIPGWKKKNGCLEILYYRAFLEFPIH